MVNLIVAIGKDNLIGKGNLLPWHYKEDMQYFKKMTMNKKVIMGELTFKSIISYINKPLPGRISIIATLTDYTYKGIEVTNDVISFLRNFPKDEEVFITHVNKEYDGDVYFKEIDYSKYNKISEKVSGDLNFSIYERIE